MTMRVGFQVAAGTALGLLMSITAAAAAEDEVAILCAVSQLFECVDGGACRPTSPEAIGGPRFLRVDKASDRIGNPELPERAPGAEVVHSARMHGKLFLQGTDPGIEALRSGVAWTFALAEDERRMVLTAAGDAVAYVGFGACLPTP
jgi:hypothetical protein